MVNDWFDFSLGEILDITSSKRIFRSDYCESGVPFYRSKEIIEKSKGNNISTELFISEDKFEALKNKFGAPEPGDILLTSVGTLGVPYLVKNEDHFYFKDGNLTWFRNFSDQIMPKYLHLWFTSALAKRQINEITIGSTQQALTISSLKSLMLKVPPLAQQKAIVHILGSLDDKIELNRQMNETLEAMAQALFKSWFVDFDPVIDNAIAAGNAIPDEFAERAEQRKAIERKDSSDIQNLFPDEFEFTEEIGWIPKGWGSGMLADICFFGKGKINTSELSLENYVSTENMNKEKAGISYAASIASTSQVPKFSVGQTLISNIRPYFKKIWLASFSGGRSNDVLGFQANDAVANEYLFSLLYQDSFFDYMTATSKGTKMPRGDKAAIMSWSVAIPPLILMEEFSNKVKPMYLANNIRSKQAISLSELRDTLLPKLMSGELRIPDAETLVDETL